MGRITMTYEQIYLIHLLSCAIKRDIPKIPQKDVDWGKIWKIAEEQKILPLLFEAVKKLDKRFLPSQEIMKKWEDDTLSCTFFFALQTQQIYSVLDAAEEKGVDMLVLKGMALRELYPVPELRTMSDCDVIIKDEQFEKAEEAFSACGYVKKGDHKKQTNFAKPGALKFEVFSSIPTGLKSADGRAIDVWNNTRPVIEKHVVKPSAENMLLHSVTHLMKHLRTRGAGIRNLADMVLLLEKEEMNWEYLLEQLKFLKAEKLFYGLLRALEKYFDYKIPINCPDIDGAFVDKLMEYMVSNGVYGVMHNAFILDARQAAGKRSARIKNYVTKIFPPAQKMSEKYNYAKKYPFLLPVAWVHRMFNVVFIDGHSVKSNINSMKSATDVVNEQMEILEYFKI